MRIAKCTRPLHLNVIGNLANVAIGEGWIGDLDQVISRTDRGPRTLADELGEHFNEANFMVLEPAAKANRVKASAPPAHEE